VAVAIHSRGALIYDVGLNVYVFNVTSICDIVGPKVSMFLISLSVVALKLCLLGRLLLLTENSLDRRPETKTKLNSFSQMNMYKSILLPPLHETCLNFVQI
jgi:hypothetical protein